MASAKGPSYTVMVVDDDPSVLATYGRLLRRAGYRTLTEGDPSNALRDDQVDCGIDLLLLDHRMPAMDGLTLLAELRRRACKARCILVSAYLNDDVRRRAATLGVDRVLEKPVDVCLLRRVIRDLLPVADGGEAAVGWNGTERAKA